MNTIYFFLGIVLTWIVIFAVQKPVRKKNCRLLNAVVLILKLLLIPIFAIMFIAMEWMITYKYGFLFNAAYIALIGDTAAGVIEYLVSCVRRHKDRDDKHSKEERTIRDQRLIAIIGIAACIVLTTYGYINSQRFVMKTHEWQAEGLTREHTFAFVADIHAGTAQPVESLHDLCSRINDADPEFVILGGDVTDELTTYEDMISTYEILSEINAPIYFIYGNHDRQPNANYYNGRTYTDEQLTELILSAGITILKDEYAEIADDLMLLGREDYTTAENRKAWSELSSQNSSGRALVVADHQPYDNEQLEKAEFFLQVSGHTHAGQLFPIQLIYRALGLQAYGEFDYADSVLYVSAGASEWMTPFRTEEHCEWDLITLKP